MKILIAEDELVSRKKLEILIKSIGYEPLVASDGEEGWNLWKTHRPRMVLTDWMMPGLSGPELCKKIRNAEGSRYTYLIIVTAKHDTKDIVRGIDQGADDFISKPYVKEEIEVRIRAGERVIGYEVRDLVIFSLAKLAESRDPETGNHLERMRYYSRALTEAIRGMENTPEEIDAFYVENIFLSSPLHDIGKIGIPDFVLLKPGHFDDNEFEIMKGHSRIGFETLNEAINKYPKAEFLKMSADIAHYHHEKYDGSGYPDGLSGENIPLSARIVALADAYDALVSRRVYKQAVAHEMAKSIILREKGTHFDPMMVDAFLICENEFIQIRNQFKE
ncbi:HD domain-containing phosphohydrolase [uncultured Desulfobacter sp.]|uniref:HD domain-containing phosphohydrolase n=1 Tax=uncultured Desulfobacter sp. TaxID=240139 RepID=UPI002AA5ED8E|nr:HD domain-containing phosphohydrolase [uncultured Desulfobacter sp.]